VSDSSSKRGEGEIRAEWRREEAKRVKRAVPKAFARLGARTLLDRLPKPDYLEEKGKEGLALAGQLTLDFAGKR